MRIRRRSSMRGQRATCFSRRQFLGGGLQTFAYLALGRLLAGCGGGAGGGGGGGPTPGPVGRLGDIGPLADADANGLKLPSGFTSRVIAKANEPVARTSFVWHTDPDGGAVYPHPEGGWVYVSNREFQPGGVNALRFDSAGEIQGAYNILPGTQTRLNCSGGVTPWRTWLSCEEWDGGAVWECDPFGVASAVQRTTLGNFAHEAAAVDPRTNVIYLTEDQPDSRFYRFVPATPNVGGIPDLSMGKLQAMRVLNAGGPDPWAVDWLDVPMPNPLHLPETPPELQPQMPTRRQLPESTAFDGGEGLWYHGGLLFFTTKGDGRVWEHDPVAGTLHVRYDDGAYPEPILDSVDNIVATPGGDLVIVEDKSEANQQAVALTVDGRIVPLVELTGQDGSEVTGPAFSPDGRNFYFSSQRGPGPGGQFGTAGVTYCVTGPFFDP